MSSITIKKIDPSTFNVTVTTGMTTNHRVTLTDDYYKKLTEGKTSKEELIKKSFEFLLERESNTSILSSFDLPVIGTYFPEYEGEIKKYL